MVLLLYGIWISAIWKASNCVIWNAVRVDDALVALNRNRALSFDLCGLVCWDEVRVKRT